MAKSDVDFTFDTTAFKNGLKQVAGGIADVSKNTVNMAKNVSRGVINAAAKIGLLKLAFRGVQAVIREMPEISKAFGIAKDIIMKNFLFPLRKAIFPMLQKFLNWVRDNRAMFVKWGQTLVTIFRVASRAIGRVIEIGKGLLRTFGDFFNKTFGTQIKGMNDLLNIISFKFAVAVEFLSRLLKPIVDMIKPIIAILLKNIKKIAEPISNIAGNIIEIVDGLLSAEGSGESLVGIFESIMNFVGDAATFAAEMVDSFIEGLKPHITPMAKTIKEIADSFKSIFDSIFGSSEKLEGWKQVFKFIGDVIGTTVLSTFQVLEQIVTAIDNSLKSANDLGNLLAGKETSEDFGKNLGNAIVGMYDLFNPAQAIIRREKEKNVKDAIIKPDGSVINTDPADYLIATKTPGSLASGGIALTLNFPSINVNVQEATTQEAVNFSETIVDQVRSQLNLELERMGS